MSVALTRTERRHLRSYAWTRPVVVSLSFPLVIAGPYAALIASEDGAVGWAVVGLAVAFGFGALAARWWTVLLPSAWTAVSLISVRVSDLLSGACSVCGYEENWVTVPIIVFVLVTLPVTAAVAGGVLLSAVTRWLRDAGEAER